MNNLPSWPHASECYSKAYRLLEEMARRGHVTAPDMRKHDWVQPRCYVSGKMQRLIAALAAGDEKAIKGALLDSDRILGVSLPAPSITLRIGIK